MTKNATYCDKHVSSQKCIFFVVMPCPSFIITYSICHHTMFFHSNAVLVHQTSKRKGWLPNLKEHQQSPWKTWWCRRNQTSPHLYWLYNLRESWIRGSSDSQIISIGWTDRLWRYKIEDFISCPDGTLLGVEGNLGITDIDISSFVTDLV